MVIFPVVENDNFTINYWDYNSNLLLKFSALNPFRKCGIFMTNVDCILRIDFRIPW